jgi:hypothetical protein
MKVTTGWVPSATVAVVNCSVIAGLLAAGDALAGTATALKAAAPRATAARTRALCVIAPPAAASRSGRADREFDSLALLEFLLSLISRDLLFLVMAGYRKALAGNNGGAWAIRASTADSCTFLVISRGTLDA